MQMAYVIDTYNKYNKFDKENSNFIFNFHGIQYAIKEIKDTQNIPQPFGQEIHPETYQIYKTYEDALKFVQTIKSL